MNPRQNRAFDDYCDKLAIDGGIVSLADRWHPVYQTLSVHLCRAESVRSFNDDMPWRNFPSPELRTQFQRELFQQVPVFPMHMPKEASVPKTSRFDRSLHAISACDGPRYGHVAIVSTHHGILVILPEFLQVVVTWMQPCALEAVKRNKKMA